MKLSGHKTRSVFDRYNVVSDGDSGAKNPKILSDFVYGEVAERLKAAVC
jgi:hypothetical protein